MREFKNPKSPVVKNLLRTAHYNSQVAKYINGMLNPSAKVYINPQLFGSPTASHRGCPLVSLTKESPRGVIPSGSQVPSPQIWKVIL